MVNLVWEKKSISNSSFTLMHRCTPCVNKCVLFFEVNNLTTHDHSYPWLHSHSYMHLGTIVHAYIMNVFLPSSLWSYLNLSVYLSFHICECLHTLLHNCLSCLVLCVIDDFMCLSYDCLPIINISAIVDEWLGGLMYGRSEHTKTKFNVFHSYSNL